LPAVLDVNKHILNMFTVGNLGNLTVLAARSNSIEEEDAKGDNVLAAPRIAVFLAVVTPLFKICFNPLSRISGGHAGNGENSEDVLHKHVEGFSGKRNLC
jgi:hypothetical protein